MCVMYVCDVCVYWIFMLGIMVWWIGLTHRVEAGVAVVMRKCDISGCPRSGFVVVVVCIR